MNRFIVDNLPHRIAEALCDQHIVKMPLEEAQMLCTALWHHAPSYAVQHSLYKPAHQKHPCTLWSQATRANYMWAVSLYVHMLREYSYRFGKQHGAAKHEVAIINGMIEGTDMHKDSLEVSVSNSVCKRTHISSRSHTARMKSY